MHDKSGERIGSVAIIRDITERKQAERKYNRLISAIEQTTETVMIMGADGTIGYINPAMTQILGYTREEVVGINPFFTERGIYSNSFYQHIWETISRGGVWSGRLKNRKNDGALIEFEATLSPIRDSAGNITGYVSIGRDATRETRLEQQLRQAQKMEALGTMAGGIAHDFNNILSAVMGFTELARSEAAANSKQHDNLSMVLKASSRARDLVRQILTFSRQTEQEMKPVAVTPIVKEIIKLIRASVPATIDIRCNLTAKHDIIIAAPTQLHQILMNLCTNASHAMHNSGGTLEISLFEIELDRRMAAPLPDLDPGRYVHLVVSDTGPGMSPDIVERIFEPYFTTKPKAEGTGMGLAVVHGIVKSLGGAITVKSEPGTGTAFHLYMPLIDITGTLPQEDASRDPCGTERILFVEDEPDVCDMGGQMLKSLGYSVMAVQSPEEALQAFSADPDSYDLVISDKTMPRMTGFELAGRIRALHRGIPVVICTGFQSDEDMRKARDIGVSTIITKPFSRTELADTVRAALDKKSKQQQ
jgi:PAS domain S-box-containing protein